MNEERFDMEIKEKLKNGTREIPEIVAARIDETLSSLPRRRKAGRRVGYLSAAAVLAMVCIMGAWFMSPTFAQALEKIPLIGSVFQFIGDTGLKNAQEKGLVTNFIKTASDKGIDLTITDVLYDGVRLSIGYIQKSEEGNRRPREINLYVDGKRLSTGYGGRDEKIDENQYAGIVSFTTREELPDHFNLRIEVGSMHWWDGEKTNEVRGNWSFNIPVSKIKTDVRVYSFETVLSKSYKDTTIGVRKVTFSPGATEVILEGTQPIGTECRFEVIDDRGNLLKPLSSSGSGEPLNMDSKIQKSSWKLVFEPLAERPEYLTLRTISAYEIASVSITGDFPVVVSKGKAWGEQEESIIVTAVEYTGDKAVVRFKAECASPWWPMWLRDGSGKEYIGRHTEPESIGPVTHIGANEFPGVSKDEEIELISPSIITSPEELKELEIRIPID